jgi:hypothetical protein
MLGPPSPEPGKPCCAATRKLERELCRELELPWVEHSPRRAEKAIRNRRARYRRQVRTGDRGPINRIVGRSLGLGLKRGCIFVILRNCGASAYDRGTIHGGNFVHVWPVQQVEGVNDQVEPVALVENEVTRYAQIPCVEVIAGVGVPA